MFDGLWAVKCNVGEIEMEKNAKRRVKKYQWVITLCITTVIAMWIYGMVRIYYPDPLYVGIGQYMDLGTGIIIFTLVISGLIVTAIFKKTKKR